MLLRWSRESDWESVFEMAFQTMFQIVLEFLMPSALSSWSSSEYRFPSEFAMEYLSVFWIERTCLSR